MHCIYNTYIVRINICIYTIFMPYFYYILYTINCILYSIEYILFVMYYVVYNICNIPSSVCSILYSLYYIVNSSNIYYKYTTYILQTMYDKYTGSQQILQGESMVKFICYQEQTVFKLYMLVICTRSNKKSKYDSDYIRRLFVSLRVGTQIRKTNRRSQIIYNGYLHEIQIRRANKRS